MEIQPIAGLPPAQGFIGGPPPPRVEEPENPEIVGLATSYENQVFLIRRNDPTLNHFFIGSCVGVSIYLGILAIYFLVQTLHDIKKSKP